MTEAMVANLFTVLRVLLIGGILMVLPLITRKGLLFGAYVGEETAEESDTDRESALCLNLVSTRFNPFMQGYLCVPISITNTDSCSFYLTDGLKAINVNICSFTSLTA